MAKIKNKSLYSNDPERLRFWDEELTYLGRPHRLDLKGGRVVVFALPPQKPKKKRDENKREPRNKRAESAARNS